MIIEQLVVGELGANCYIVGCQETGEAVIIDPGGNGEKIHQQIKELDMTPSMIINTHGHVDHIGANSYLKEHTDAELGIHPKDAPMLTDPKLNLSMFTGKEIISPSADIHLNDGDSIKVGNLKGEIINTPGHTPGGICIKIDNNLFSGDTLFTEGIGRCDLPGGNQDELLKSIREQLFTLSDDLVVYPGHGGSTTIAHEKRKNPFLK
ncbi:MBL fold metallo-hydrolase [Natranaerobius thermophilus]|uniref:Beta-lactamase domain protein n=1 Tax=Natranaerobius thermophilus (strain ATCC BAA-1301 / DSM 18059 / JW/NM-WN-LF) TaxID=457570 RepID=B2A2F8_NATTJ|nr:MBL fold metallo-hydrolase [Natranaerobius thermophilus]ACB84873.1 beta-lactamase domain protein [Natranaerobius thermophilus JW/NM-WN-LF]